MCVCVLLRTHHLEAFETSKIGYALQHSLYAAVFSFNALQHSLYTAVFSFNTLQHSLYAVVFSLNGKECQFNAHSLTTVSIFR